MGRPRTLCPRSAQSPRPPLWAPDACRVSRPRTRAREMCGTAATVVDDGDRELGSQLARGKLDHARHRDVILRRDRRVVVRLVRDGEGKIGRPLPQELQRDGARRLDDGVRVVREAHSRVVRHQIRGARRVCEFDHHVRRRARVGRGRDARGEAAHDVGHLGHRTAHVVLQTADRRRRRRHQPRRRDTVVGAALGLPRHHLVVDDLCRLLVAHALKVRPLELLHHVHQLSRRERRAVRVLDVEQESRRQLALVLRRRGNVLEERVLPPPAVVLPLVRVEGEQHEQREHQERDHGLPHVDNVGRRHHEDDDQPEVRPNGKGCGDGVHSHVGDLAAVVRGNRHNADRNDDEEIEGGGADDGGRAELAGEAIVRQQLDDGEQDLGR
mmetsp:Transcript_2105/g.6297  ORF Transcript_2105/g.6297 Transcript_2105/m.6297 type:complete len:383 (-) Transcript_2105:367-1515(-)